MPELLQTQERAETELAVPPPGISKPVFLVYSNPFLQRVTIFPNH